LFHLGLCAEYKGQNFCYRGIELGRNGLPNFDGFVQSLCQWRILQNWDFLPAREFFMGPKLNSMKKDELIAAFLVEPAKGPQQFAKVGTRNAMVIAVCSFAIASSRPF